ncbi:MAG TPA: hypothetical protein VIX37_11850 [Candidatus Sulfotelmatobacter sp.]
MEIRFEAPLHARGAALRDGLHAEVQVPLRRPAPREGARGGRGVLRRATRGRPAPRIGKARAEAARVEARPGAAAIRGLGVMTD